MMAPNPRIGLVFALVLGAWAIGSPRLPVARACSFFQDEKKQSGAEEGFGPSSEAPADSVQTPRIPADGYQWLSYLLTAPNWQGGGQKLVPKWAEWVNPENPNGRRLASTRTILVLGDTTGLELPGLEQFVRDGGTLVVASDQKLWEGREGLGNALVHLMGNGAVVTGEKVKAFGRNAGFQGQSRLIPLVAEGATRLFAGRAGLVSPVVSNSPSRVQGQDGQGVIHARFQGMVELMPSGPRRDDAIFALGTGPQDTSAGQGRVLLLADPEVLCNQMLTLPGNLAFACNLAEWITAGDLPAGQSRRGQLLLIVNGQVVDKPFVPPLPMPDIPMPNLPKEDLFTLLYRLAEGGMQAGESILAKMEDENIPDKAGSAILGALWPRPLLIMAACAVGFWLFVSLTGRTLNQDMADLRK